ncbi:MAG: glycosyltransferase family 2 protein [Rhodocyclaceae bacterium]|nr:glycosyltransferase family 2 protein [Rhodocyclaceae bacterium]
MHKLSAVLITRDAAGSLPACLASLGFCDEMLVVDAGSTDDTLAIARQAGARIIETHWRGFGPQKQFAVEQASHDWVLCIDADEQVTPELAATIQAVLSAGRPSGRKRPEEAAPTFSCYQFSRRNQFMGRYLRHGEGYPDWSLRLFDRRHARWSEDAVHERVIATGEVGTLAGDLLHDSAESLERYLDKQNRYSSLAAEAAIKNGKRSSAPRLLISPVIRFIKFYLLRAGFRDGLPGLVHILIGCYASFAKHAKMLAYQISSTDKK